MESNRARAEKILTFYLKTAWKRAGLNWSDNNDADMGHLVDLLQGMVNDAIQEHTENAPRIHADGSTS